MSNHTNDGQFYDQLESHTNFEALVRALYGDYRVAGGEMWLVCPFDESTREDQFSISQIDGRWMNHKSGEGGTMISLLKKTHPGKWRDAWAGACPETAKILLPNRDGPGSQPPAPSPRATARANVAEPGGPLIPEKAKPKKDFGSVYDTARKGMDVADFEQFVEAYGVPQQVFVDLGIVVQKGGWHGPEPRLVIPGLDPATGVIYGLKIRALGATLRAGRTDDRPRIKSMNMGGSKAGLIGWRDGDKRPVLLVEGEKDWVVASNAFRSHHVMTSTNGAGSFQSAWAKALAGRDVVLMFDDDEAGNRGASKAAALLHNEGCKTRVAHLGTPDKDVFDHLTEDGLLGKEGLLALITGADSFSPGKTKLDVESYLRGICMGEDMRPVEVGEALFEGMRKNGAQFLRIGETEAICNWFGKSYQMGVTDPRWGGLIWELSHLSPAEAKGREILTHMKMRAVCSGDKVEPTTWVAYRDDRMYLPLYGEEQKILEMSADGLRAVPNGHDGVTLLPGTQFEVIDFLDDARYDPEAAGKAWSTFWDLFNVTRDWRDLLEALFITLPFYGLIDTRPILRFQGMPGSGKSFITRAMTLLLYGEDLNSGGNTTAAIYRQTNKRMVIALDNFEERDLARDREMQTLLLRSVSGTAREKSVANTDSAVMRQEVNCWFMLNGKSPIGLGLEDMEERLAVVPIGGNRIQGFSPSRMSQWIKQNRSLLLSYFYRRVSAAFQLLIHGRRDEMIRQLPQNQRPRLHEWYAMLAVARGEEGSLSDTVKGWLTSGSDGEEDSVVESSELVPLLCRMPSFFATAYDRDAFASVEHSLNMNGEVWSCTIHSQTLHSLLSAIKRATGLAYTAGNSKSLASQLNVLNTRSCQRGISLTHVATQSRIPGTQSRAKAWKIEIDKAMIQVIPPAPQAERLLGMTSGEEIEVQATSPIAHLPSQGGPRE